MKNKLIIGVVALVIIGAGVWYFTSRDGGIIPGTEVKNAETFAQLMAAGRPLKCTITPTVDNGNMIGTFYMVNKKVRGDYTVTTGGQPMAGHMIVDGNTTYSWFEGQPAGFKMANTVEPSTGSVPVAEDRGFDPNALTGYKCEGWAADASKFVLPANVNFSDMGAFGAGAEVTTPPAGGTPAGNAAQCAACDQVPAAYKAQCRSSLGCK